MEPEEDERGGRSQFAGVLWVFWGEGVRESGEIQIRTVLGGPS